MLDAIRLRISMLWQPNIGWLCDRGKRKHLGPCDAFNRTRLHHPTTLAQAPPHRGRRRAAPPGLVILLLHHLLVLLAILQLAGQGRASQALLHAAANQAEGHAGARVGARHAVVDWGLYHRTDALLARVHALAATCPHALAQRLALADDGGTEHELLVVTLAAGAADRRHPPAVSAAAVGAPMHPAAMAPPVMAPAPALKMVVLPDNMHRQNASENDAGSKGGDGASARWPEKSLVAEKRARVLAVFGEHGREFVSAEVALRLVERVCAPPTNSEDEQVREELLKELERTELVLIPVISPQGRKMAEEGRSCERLNARGVDVNRNFGHEWGKSDNSTIKSEERPGRGPFSEFESRAAHVLALHIQPHAYISVHSGGQAIIVPWDSAGKLPDEPASRKDISKVADVLRGTNCPGCLLGTAKDLFGYCAYGTGVDFMHAILHVPIALTWEIFGDPHASEDDCVRFFNPLTKDSFTKTVNNWSRAFGTLSASLHSLETVKIASRKPSVLRDSWAFVASRLGHSSWTPSAYRASLKTDNYVAPVEENIQRQIARDANRQSALSFGAAIGDPNHILVMIGAMLTVLGFLAMVYMMRRNVLRPSSSHMRTALGGDRRDEYGVRQSASSTSGSALIRRTGRLIGSIMSPTQREGAVSVVDHSNLPTKSA
jgi:Zinc carboxypeptidase